MSKETVAWYVQLTGGQLQAFLHGDGNWYLYAPKPVVAGIASRIPVGDADATGGDRGER